MKKPIKVFCCDTCNRYFSEIEFVETIEEYLCERCASGYDPDDPECNEDYDRWDYYEMGGEG